MKSVEQNHVKMTELHLFSPLNVVAGLSLYGAFFMCGSFTIKSNFSNAVGCPI